MPGSVLVNTPYPSDQEVVLDLLAQQGLSDLASWFVRVFGPVDLVRQVNGPAFGAANRDLYFPGDLYISGGLRLRGSIITGGDLHVEGDLAVGGIISAGRSLKVSGDIKAGLGIEAGQSIVAGGSITAGPIAAFAGLESRPACVTGWITARRIIAGGLVRAGLKIEAEEVVECVCVEGER